MRDRQLDTLALAGVGMTQRVSAKLEQIARPAQRYEPVQQRTAPAALLGQRTDHASHPRPPAGADSHAGVREQPVHLLLDRVLRQDRHNLLVVSVGLRRRSRPLAWIALDHRGKSRLADQQAVLTAALTVLPDRVRVTVHADSAVRARALLYWVQERQRDAMLGMYGNTPIRLTLQGPQQPLERWLPQRDTVATMPEGYGTEAGFGPVHVRTWWAKNADGTWMVRGVMTNLPATWQTSQCSSRRMGIEKVFRAW